MQVKRYKTKIHLWIYFVVRLLINDRKWVCFSSSISNACVFCCLKRKKGKSIDEMWWYINEAYEMNINNDSAKISNKIERYFFVQIFICLNKFLSQYSIYYLEKKWVDKFSFSKNNQSNKYFFLRRIF